MSIKRNLWKVGIAIAGMQLLLVFMMWLSVPAVGAQGGVSGSATPGTATVQATPIVDATVTALNKEKLMQEIDQLKNQNYWAWTAIGSIGGIATFLLALVGFTTAILGFRQWLGNRRDEQVKRDEEQRRWLDDRQAEREKRDEEQQRWLKNQEAEREKRAEERFQSAVIGLGDDKEGARIGAAILLRTFLRPGYEQFYIQTFDLAVANLRLQRTSQPPEEPTAPLPLTTLSQALIVVFKEAFPLARENSSGDHEAKGAMHSLDATGVQLDSAYLAHADLKHVWMPQASLRGANLFDADLGVANLSEALLSGANLTEADLSGTALSNADLSGANLPKTKFIKATLIGADLSETFLKGANLSGAILTGATLTRAELSETNLSGAHLSVAFLNGAKLLQANLSEANLSGTDLNGANLQQAHLSRAKGLTKEQLVACKAKGAIIDEDTTASSSQAPVSPPAPPQSTETQTQSTPPAQGSIPIPDAGKSSTTSSSPES